MRRWHFPVAARLAAEVAFDEKELAMRLRARLEWLWTLLSTAAVLALVFGFQAIRWRDLIGRVQERIQRGSAGGAP